MKVHLCPCKLLYEGVVDAANMWAWLGLKTGRESTLVVSQQHKYPFALTCSGGGVLPSPQTHFQPLGRVHILKLSRLLTRRAFFSTID